MPEFEEMGLQDESVHAVLEEFKLTNATLLELNPARMGLNVDLAENILVLKELIGKATDEDRDRFQRSLDSAREQLSFSLYASLHLMISAELRHQ